MMRSPSLCIRVLPAVAILALPAIAHAQADTRPIVAILSFDNNSIGAGRQDYEGIGKGIQETLIADMAANGKIRLVDRERIQRVLDEQHLAKSGSVDPATAVRVGKILGAQYAIYGGFMSDGRGNLVLTAHSTDMETSALGNAMKVQRKTDDVLGLISEMTAKLNGEIKFDSKPGRRVGDAGAAAAMPVQSGVPAPAKSQVETFAKPVSQKVMKTKLDIATMKLYSNALDEMDKKNSAKAAALFRQVLAKFPDFEPAQRNLDKLPGKASD
jgi:TolB-like protein